MPDPPSPGQPPNPRHHVVRRHPRRLVHHNQPIHQASLDATHPTITAGRSPHLKIKFKGFLYARPLEYGPHAPARAGRGDLAADASKPISAPFNARAWSPNPRPPSPDTSQHPELPQPSALSPQPSALSRTIPARSRPLAWCKSRPSLIRVG
ncbi:hypothetical protein Aiant_30440 [Actinoplanes ianthinogenes]|uniref:Uncharacterized protein n=1 Tax=Actinoplanes ianthinogenes TaxID=122358 RepID=A0ABN6CDL5_9ACTN|nr:hypothetical protein Aiant_30440 [Actinoplanes ianthinogenes]